EEPPNDARVGDDDNEVDTGRDQWHRQAARPGAEVQDGRFRAPRERQPGFEVDCVRDPAVEIREPRIRMERIVADSAQASQLTSAASTGSLIPFRANFCRA